MELKNKLKKIKDQYYDIVKTEINRLGLNIEPEKILALIYQESRGYIKAYRREPGYYKKYIEGTETGEDLLQIGVDKNNFGSVGLMQVLLDNCYRIDPAVINWFDYFNISKNIRIGLKVFSYCYEKYDHNYFKALQCYNAGGNLEAGRKYAEIVTKYYNLIKGV